MPPLFKITKQYKVAGIYKITCKITKKVYVGSAKNIQRRWHIHILQLNKNIHHSIYLQRAWNKHGEKNFTFEILEIVPNPTKKKLEDREQYWMDKLKCYDFKYGFNTLHKAGSNLGYKPTRKTLERMRQVSLGCIPWNKGKKLTEEHIQNLSKSHKGKKLSKVQRKRISQRLFKHNKKHRQQIIVAYERFFKRHKYNPNQHSRNKRESLLAKRLFNIDFHKTKIYRSRLSYDQFRILNKKNLLLKLAKSGVKKPSRESKNTKIRKLANSLKSYTYTKSECYDPVFTKQIKSIRPDWFNYGGMVEQQS
jgi:group I intron endonuclease